MMLLDQATGAESICLSSSQLSRESHRFLTDCPFVGRHSAISSISFKPWTHINTVCSFANKSCRDLLPAIG